MYVCTQLTAPDAQSLQTCIAWVEQSFLPSLTYSEANLIIVAYGTLLASIWGFRRVLAIFR
jgi:hypothetical protein